MARESTTLPEAKIQLADFGEAFSPARQQRFESHTPRVNRPPETRFEPHKPLSFPSDIWSLGCSIWHIIAQISLFDGFLATEDDITCEQVDALGTLTPEWWCQWKERHSRFTDDGKPIDRESIRSWEDRFQDSVQRPRREEGMPFSRCCCPCFRLDLRLVLPLSRFLSSNGWRSGLCLSMIRFGNPDHSTANVFLMAPGSS